MLQLSKQQLNGIFGSVIMMIATNMPVLSLPLMGNLNLFDLKQFNPLSPLPLSIFAYTILLCGLASVVLSVLNYCKALFLTAALSIASSVYVMFGLQHLKKGAEQDAVASFIMKMTATTIDYTNFKWGWTVLLIGVILMFSSASMRSQTKA